MKFKKEDLKDLIWNAAPEEFVKISDEIADTSRWSIHHDMIFSYNGKFYITYYSVGATEQQYEEPYMDDPDEIECEEVVPVEKTITVYESLPK